MALLTIQSITLDNWTSSETVPRLRARPSREFLALNNSGAQVLINGQEFWGEWVLSTSTRTDGQGHVIPTVIIPAIEIYSTKDAIGFTGAYWIFDFFDSKGNRIGPYRGFDRTALPASFSGSLNPSWSSVYTFNHPTAPILVNRDTLNREQILSLVLASVPSNTIPKSNGVGFVSSKIVDNNTDVVISPVTNIVGIDTAAASAELRLRRVNGTLTSPTDIITGNILGLISAVGFDNGGYSPTSASIKFVAQENWGPGGTGSKIDFVSTSIGGGIGLRRLTLNESGFELKVNAEPIAASFGFSYIWVDSASFVLRTKDTTGVVLSNTVRPDSGTAGQFLTGINSDGIILKSALSSSNVTTALGYTPVNPGIDVSLAARLSVHGAGLGTSSNYLNFLDTDGIAWANSEKIRFTSPNLVFRTASAGQLKVTSSSSADIFFIKDDGTGAFSSSGLAVGSGYSATVPPTDGLLVAGSSVFGPVGAALSTSATSGFVYIPSCAGTPTGVPASFTGKVALVYDSTNNRIYIYNGAWKSVVLA